MLHSRYGEYIKIECMEILTLFLDSRNTEIGIFIGDCLSYCSKFSRARSVVVLVVS